MPEIQTICQRATLQFAYSVPCEHQIESFQGLWCRACLDFRDLNDISRIICVIAVDALQKASTVGSVRVLVILHDKTSSQIENKSNVQRKSEVANKVSSVLNRLSEKNRRLYDRFNFVPAFAIGANAMALRKL